MVRCWTLDVHLLKGREGREGLVQGLFLIFLTKQNYIYKTLNRAVGKAMHRYEMISDKDRIAVGLSGGKDSLALMWILKERQSRVPINYELFAIYIDPGFDGGGIH